MWLSLQKIYKKTWPLPNLSSLNLYLLILVDHHDFLGRQWRGADNKRKIWEIVREKESNLQN